MLQNYLTMARFEIVNGRKYVDYHLGMIVFVRSENKGVCWFT